MTALTHIKTVDMANLKSFPEVIAKLKSSGIDVPGQFNKETFNSTVKIPFPNALIGNLEKRFDDKSVMAAFDVFDIRKIPNVSHPRQLRPLHHIESLHNHFSTWMNVISPTV